MTGNCADVHIFSFFSVVCVESYNLFFWVGFKVPSNDGHSPYSLLIFPLEWSFGILGLVLFSMLSVIILVTALCVSALCRFISFRRVKFFPVCVDSCRVSVVSF